MKKLQTKIFLDLFSEINLSSQKQRYVDSLCYNSLETPCISAGQPVTHHQRRVNWQYCICISGLNFSSCYFDFESYFTVKLKCKLLLSTSRISGLYSVKFIQPNVKDSEDQLACHSNFGPITIRPFKNYNIFSQIMYWNVAINSESFYKNCLLYGQHFKVSFFRF